MTKSQTGLPFWAYALLSLTIMAAAAGIELANGRRPLAKSGRFYFWVTETDGPETSQQLFDWYSFTHVTHGMLLYGLYHLLRKRLPGRAWGWPLGVGLVLGVGIESTWEVVENSNFIIDRYRQTMAQGYYGDTILNSMSDIFCCIVGFGLAARQPGWVTVAIIITVEIGLALAIRDNLTLNVVMLIHPFEAIRHWQLGS